MTPFRRTPSRAAPDAPHASWAAETVELAAVFLAVALAHLFVSLVGQHADGSTMLAISGIALIAGSILHRWWGARARRPVAGAPRSASTWCDPLTMPAAHQGIWRVRATLSDRPGSLASLSAKLAALDVNILAIQVHSATDHSAVDGVTDELLVAAPPKVTTAQIAAAVQAGGGSGISVVAADVHDLVDPPTRALALATRAAADPEFLPDALGRLLYGSTVTASPDPADGESHIQIQGPEGRTLNLSRPGLPFTPTELSRARALVELCAHLSPRDAHPAR